MTSARRHSTAPPNRNRLPEPEIAPPPPTPLPIYDRQQQNVERIGDILRRTREKRGDDLHHIAEYLCIRRAYLAAIENSEYEKFPADAYVIGFLRSYAELLGLDGKEAINLYRAEMAGRRKKPVLTMPTPMAEGRAPSAFVLIGAVVSVILVYALWYGLSSSDRATVSAPPSMPTSSSAASNASVASSAADTAPVVPVVPVATVPPVTAVPNVQAVSPTSDADSVAKPVAKAMVADTSMAGGLDAAGKPSHVSIHANQSSWVMIQDGKGTTIFDRVLKPGETYRVPDEKGLMLTTGNIPGIVLALDGTDLPRLSSVGSNNSGVMRDISLDPSRLKAETQQR